MLPIERKSQILEFLQKYKTVTVAELSKKYNVTEETIRRDLEKLEQEGLAQKTYGGAILSQALKSDLPFKIREQFMREEKLTIAKKIFNIVNDGENIILDSSSTSFVIAKLLKQKKKLTIITNSVEILLEMSSSKNITILSTGGLLRDSYLSLVGKTAENMLRQFNADKAIISCKGLDKIKGVTDSNETEVHVKQVMIDCCKKAILAVDSSKFKQVYFSKIASISDFDTIVSEKYDEDFLEYFKQNNINIL